MRKALLAIVLACLAAPAAAQETGTPVFMAPYRAFEQMEFGAMFSDPGIGNWAIEGEYGFGFGVYDISVNGGYLDLGDGGAGTFGGALYGERRYSRVFAGHNGAQSYYGARAFRGSLRV